MTAEQHEDLAEGTLLSHLVELRSRLFKMFGAVFLVFIALLPFAKIVAIGADDIMQLQEQGFSYISW